MDDCDHTELCGRRMIIMLLGGHRFVARFYLCQMDRIPMALFQWAENEDLPLEWKDVAVMLANILYYVHGEVEEEVLFLDEPTGSED